MVWTLQNQVDAMSPTQFRGITHIHSPPSIDPVALSQMTWKEWGMYRQYVTGGMLIKDWLEQVA